MTFRIFCTGVEPSSYGIFGSIPPVGPRVPKSFPSETVNVADFGERHFFLKVSDYRKMILGGGRAKRFDMSGFVALPVETTLLGPGK